MSFGFKPLATSLARASFALWRDPRFWLAQAAWWLITYGLDTFPFWTGEEITAASVVHLVSSMLLALAGSSILGGIYLALPERWLQAWKGAAVVVASCFAMGFLWHCAEYAQILLSIYTTGSFLHGWSLDQVFWVTKIYLAWSALFLVIVQAQRAAGIRERELMSDALARQAELRSLRSQLNPSFMVDAIDAVAQTIDAAPERARALLHEVADLLRGMLRATRADTTSLGDALDFEAHYLRYEALRSGERLRFRVEAPDALRKLPVTSLLLHPLVEDAVHSSSQTDSPRSIEVITRAAKAGIEVDVRRTKSSNDAAASAPAARLEALSAQLRKAYPHSGSITHVRDDHRTTMRLAFDPDEHSSRHHAGAASPPAHRSTECDAVGLPVLPDNRWFWLLQMVVGLTIYGWAFAGPAFGHLHRGTPLTSFLTTHALGFVAAALGSAALAWGCAKLSHRWLSRGYTPLALVRWCLALCCAWALGAGVWLLVSVPRESSELSWALALDLLYDGAGLAIVWTCIPLFAAIGLQLSASRARMLKNEALAHEAQLRALRAQLNPHFMFNALCSVLPMIRLDTAAAREMLADLEHLVRRALATTRTSGTTLAEELDFVSRYLRCETARFDFLSVTMRVPDALLPAPIPSMLLQPLVENAIKHGMPKGTAKLHVEVSAKLTGERLVLEVKNTGTLTREPAAQTTWLRSEEVAGLGAGLRIVRERIATRYPSSGSFELFDETGWVVARIAYDVSEQAQMGAREPSAPAPELTSPDASFCDAPLAAE